jgi:hypothetical protein
MHIQKKFLFALVIISIVSSGILIQEIKPKNKYIDGIISSLNGGDFITASGQYGGGGPTVTIAVEQFTLNHLPNITGTCSVGDTMVFEIKKGVTNVLSETITKLCDATPYALNPTITLPDGKYRVDVTISTGSGGGDL